MTTFALTIGTLIVCGLTIGGLTIAPVKALVVKATRTNKTNIKIINNNNTLLSLIQALVAHEISYFSDQYFY